MLQEWDAYSFLLTAGGCGGCISLSDGVGAALNWVVAVEGLALAQWMAAAFGVPYVEGIPLGNASLGRWRRAVCRALGRGVPPEEAEPPAPTRYEKPIALIGEPMTVDGLRGFLREEVGCATVLAGVYVPDAQTGGFYQSYAKKRNLFLFSDGDGLIGRLADAGVVAADPMLRDLAREALSDAKFLPLSQPMLSGRRGDAFSPNADGEWWKAALSDMK